MIAHAHCIVYCNCALIYWCYRASVQFWPASFFEHESQGARCTFLMHSEHVCGKLPLAYLHVFNFTFENEGLNLCVYLDIRDDMLRTGDGQHWPTQATIVRFNTAQYHCKLYKRACIKEWNRATDFVIRANVIVVPSSRVHCEGGNFQACKTKQPAPPT